MHYIYRRDTKGDPFRYPGCILSNAEFAKIISEINTNYDLYKDEPYPIHYSVGVDNRYYVYFFENHGLNDYNIVEKFEF